MTKRCFPIQIIVLTFLSTFLFGVLIADAVAKPEPTEAHIQSTDGIMVDIPKDSVLHLIPFDVLGLIYCPSLNELDTQIKMMTEDLIPQSGETELLAKTMASASGLGFKNLSDLNELGLDLNEDSAVFFSGLKPLQVSVAVHLTDPETVKQLIATEAVENTTTLYKGVNYWSTDQDGRNFAILGNILIYSQRSEVCRNVIDTQNGLMLSIADNPNYGRFLNDISKGVDLIGIYFDFEENSSKPGSKLQEELKSFTDPLVLNEDIVFGAITSQLKRITGQVSHITEQLQYISCTLQLQNTDIILKPFFKFKNDSEFLKNFKTDPGELHRLNELHDGTIMNAGVMGSPKLLDNMDFFWSAVFPKDLPEQQKQLEPLLQEMKDFHVSLVEGWHGSVSFVGSVLPDYMFIYDVNDQQKAKTFMDVVLMEKLNNYDGVYEGKSIIHNGVVIKSYVFPNLKSAIIAKFPNRSEVLPPEWHWYYAFKDEQLYFTTGTNADSIKMALDRKEGEGDKSFGNPSYHNLVERLGPGNNIFLAFSPIIMIKTYIPLFAKMDESLTTAMQMYPLMFNALPDNYSIGFSAKAVDYGMDTRLLITLGDFRSLFQIFGMMFSTDDIPE